MTRRLLNLLTALSLLLCVAAAGLGVRSFARQDHLRVGWRDRGAWAFSSRGGIQLMLFRFAKPIGDRPDLDCWSHQFNDPDAAPWLMPLWSERGAGSAS